MALSLEFTNYRFFLKRFPGCFNLFVLLFLVTPYLVVAVQLCMERIPIKEKLKTKLGRYMTHKAEI